MLPRPRPAGVVLSALLLASALGATRSLAEPRDVRAPFAPGARTFPPLASTAREGTEPSPAPNAADGTWQEFNLLQVANCIAAYDGTNDRLLSIGGFQRYENWALSLRGQPSWQPLPAPSERIFPMEWSTQDPSTGLVYYIAYITELPPHLEIHALDPLTGAVTVIPGSKLPSEFGPVHPAMVFDPVNHRLVVYGTNYTIPYGDGQVWTLDLLPTPSWSQWLPSGTPPSPYLGTFFTPTPAVLDPAGRRIVYPVALEADNGTGPLSIWTLTLDGPPQWQHFETNKLPDGTIYSVNPVVCDVPGDRLVTLGSTGDLYALSLATFQWSATHARNPGPAPRVGAGISIDKARHRLLVCGGMPKILDAFGYPTSSGSDMFSDAWALSLDHAPVWANLVPDAERSPYLPGANGGYDPARRRLVLFGGFDGRRSHNETWVVESRKDPAWSALAPRGDLPPVRFWQASAWDPVRDQLVVFGGYVGDSRNLSADLWTLSFAHGPATWSQIVPAGPAPSGRVLSQLVYDSTRDRFLLLMGGGEQSALDDAWELRLAPVPAWRRLAPAGPAPIARGAHMCVYDPGRDRVLLFGGIDDDAHGPHYGLRNDLWALEFGSGDGQWRSLEVAGGPLPRSPGLLCLDTIRDRLLLFGGYGYDVPTSIDILNDTWALDLSGTPAWRQLAPAGFRPLPRVVANGAYEAADDRLVLAGGEGYNDLWTLAFPDAPAAALPPGREGRLGAGAARALTSPPVLALSADGAGGRVSFSVQLPTGDPATLALFDIAGRCVWSTPVGLLGAGSHKVGMSGPALPPAVYFARLSQGGAMRYSRIALSR